MRKLSAVLFILYLLTIGTLVFLGLYQETSLTEIITAIGMIVMCLSLSAFLGFGMNDREKEIEDLTTKHYNNLAEVDYLKNILGISGNVNRGWQVNKSMFLPVPDSCEDEFKNWEKYTRDLKNKLDSLGNLLGYVNILKTTAAKPETSEYVWEKKKELVKLVNKKK